MFKFNLEPVLSLREKTEEQKKRELGKINTKRESLISERKRLQQTKNEQFNNGYTTPQLNVIHIRAANQYIQRLEKEIEELEIKISTVNEELENKRKELLEAVKERKILGNLKERRQEEFRLEELRIEQNTVDELVSFKYTSKESEAI